MLQTASTIETHASSIRRQLLTRILDSIRLAASAVLIVCLLALFFPEAPTRTLIGLISVIVAALATEEGSRNIAGRGADHLAAKLLITLLHVLALIAAVLLNSASFFVGLTSLMMVIAAIMIDTRTTVLAGVFGMIGYLLLPLLVGLQLTPQLSASVSPLIVVGFEALFVAAVLVVTGMLITLASKLLHSTAEESRHLARISETLRAAEEAHNQQLNTQIEEQRRLLEVIQTLEAPIVPLQHGVMVIPLVSYLDTERLAKIEERALAAVQEQHADVVFFDLTGVPVVDTTSAQRLIQIGKMLRLLGARPVLTGLRPEIALAIVGLGIQFGDLETYATIQGALTEVIPA